MISIVVPILNESENIEPLAQAISNELGQEVFEIIFVDDGSTDDTAKKIRQMHQRNPQIKLISFSRNFGHQHALTAGIDFALGDAIITMDGDFQHPPSILPKMIHKWREGYQIVHTSRKENAEAGFLKNLSSFMYYAIFRRLTGLKEIHNAADFRLLDKTAAQALRDCKEKTKFLRGLTFWLGFNSCFIEFSAPERKFGKTKFNLKRMFRLAADGILSFSALPLYISLWAGLFSFLFGVGFGIYAVWVKFVSQQSVQGWTSLVIVVSLFGGMQMLLMGFQGLYLGKIFEEVKNRPYYLIRESIGFGKNI